MGGNPMHIVLAIDDDTTILKILEQQLYAKFRVFTEFSPKKGVETAKSLNPDVILLDLNMPERNGFQVIEDLAHDPITSEIPIIVLTSIGDKSAVVNAIHLGVVDYIVKPHDYQKLIEKIQSTIRYSTLKRNQTADEKSEAILLSHTSDTVMISFAKRPSDKYFLNDARKVFTEFFFKQIGRKICVIDLRPIHDFNESDVKIMDTVFKLFASRQVFTIAGRHYGILIDKADIPDNILLFVSFGDMDLQIRKMKLDKLR